MNRQYTKINTVNTMMQVMQRYIDQGYGEKIVYAVLDTEKQIKKTNYDICIVIDISDEHK